MRKSPISGSAQDVEQMYYEALRLRDFDALMKLWADEDDVFCVHPGQARCVGFGEVRDSYQRIVNAGSLNIAPTCIKRIQTIHTCVHNVIEQVFINDNESEFVLCTNVYIKTAAGWRMCAHHASPATAQEAQEALSLPRVFH